MSKYYRNEDGGLQVARSGLFERKNKLLMSIVICREVVFRKGVWELGWVGLEGKETGRQKTGKIRLFHQTVFSVKFMVLWK